MADKTGKSELGPRARAVTRNSRLTGFRDALFGMFNTHVQEHAKKGVLKAKFSTTTISKKPADVNVGIVGGGMAGMYASMMLSELGIGHQIYEASGERLSGRVFTYYFNDAPHQYSELGAMRFPHNEMQSRLFSFWTYLNKTAPGTPGARDIVKIPYILYDDTAVPEAGNLLAFNGMPPVKGLNRKHCHDIKYISKLFPELT